MRTRWPWLFVLLAVVIVWPAATQDGAALDIYFVDVEGGAATLMIAPSGESMLVDTGHPGTVDAARIAAAADGSFTVTNGRNGFSKTYAGS